VTLMSVGGIICISILLSVLVSKKDDGDDEKSGR